MKEPTAMLWHSDNDTISNDPKVKLGTYPADKLIALAKRTAARKAGISPDEQDLTAKFRALALERPVGRRQFAAGLFALVAAIGASAAAVAGAYGIAAENESENEPSEDEDEQ